MGQASDAACYELFVPGAFEWLHRQDAAAQAKKPNILVIFGDDIGQANISRYTHLETMLVEQDFKHECWAKVSVSGP